SFPYSAGYLVAAVLFVVSVAFDGPLRYWLWAIALVAQVAGWAIGMYRWKPPATQGRDARISTTPSLIERMGLFVIIVLGEGFGGAVTGVADARRRRRG